jgi:hypothetical protein
MDEVEKGMGMIDLFRALPELFPSLFALDPCLHLLFFPVLSFSLSPWLWLPRRCSSGLKAEIPPPKEASTQWHFGHMS